jgi:hypothetical protein
MKTYYFQPISVISYKCGFIHFRGSLIFVQVDRYAYTREVKSERCAKIAITKHLKSDRALTK